MIDVPANIMKCLTCDEPPVFTQVEEDVVETKCGCGVKLDNGTVQNIRIGYGIVWRMESFAKYLENRDDLPPEDKLTKKD